MQGQRKRMATVEQRKEARPEIQALRAVAVLLARTRAS